MATRKKDSQWHDKWAGRKSPAKTHSYHLKAGKGEVAERASVEDLVPLVEVVDGDLVVEGDGLGLLDVAQGRHIKQHPVIVVGVTSNLSK